MKRLLLLLVLCLVMVVPAMALTETFQDWSYGLSTSTSSSTISIIPNPTTGAISLVMDKPSGLPLTGYAYVMNPTAIPMTYSAADILVAVYGDSGSQFIEISLYDSGGGLLYTYSLATAFVTPAPPGRYEMKMVGGQAQIFLNGVYQTQSGVLAVNPSYVRYGELVLNAWGLDCTWDNFIWAETDHHVIGAIPTNWTIQHDLLSSASDGVYAWNPTTSAWVLKNSDYFYIDADKEFGSIASPSPETLQIAKMTTGTIVNSTTQYYTHNLVAYPVAEFLATPGVTSGQYSVGFAGSTVKDYFWVIENGGWITFPKSTYNLGETAPMSWYVSPTYIDMAKYSYNYELVDVFGNVKTTGPMVATPTDTSGTVSIYFSDTTYDQGIIYAEIVATDKLDGTKHILGYSAITLTDHVQFQGYVIDAETLLPVLNANVSVTQAAYKSNTLSGPDGNYTSNASFVTSYPMTFNVTKTGYQQYTNTFTPLTGVNHALNITLLSLTPSYSGISIGGVVRDNVYGNPVYNATVNVKNGTTYQNLTNRAGFYRVDSLVDGTLYQVWSVKTGFGNSTTALKTAWGV